MLAPTPDFSSLAFTTIWMVWPTIIAALAASTYQKIIGASVYRANSSGANALVGIYSGNVVTAIAANIYTTLSVIESGGAGAGESALVYIFSPWLGIVVGFVLAAIVALIGHFARDA